MKKKLKYSPPFVFAKEDNMGHNSYAGPEDLSLTVETEKHGGPKKGSYLGTLRTLPLLSMEICAPSPALHGS